MSLLSNSALDSANSTVICIEQLPWQPCFEIISYGLHYYVEQDGTKYRTLMYPNLDLKTFTLYTIYFNWHGNTLIHAFNHINYPLLHSNMSQSPPYYIKRHSIKSLLQVHRSNPQLFLLSKELFLDLTHNKNGIRCSFSWTKSKLHLL